ncbi:quercetin dioxygenase-like cupin family protein [Paracoccus versutus]|uniref:Quercetin dioxygenase-like cupin family protein n=1 Tax=Paracoccus versutus TaxID=34007 RepID=A0AAQ0HJ21_PARVE|nr:cupin domain-containing protein [Paracoccus versutus]REG46231.1 quercetin dioxygenase-like cupin family protein [Paracoccus versutus]
MEQHFGPKAIILPDDGPRFRMNGKGVIGQIKLGPGEYPHYKFTAVRFDLQPGAKLDLYAFRFSGRMIYCLDGAGTIILNGERSPFAEEHFAHIGEGHHVALENNGDNVQQVFSIVFGSSPEARIDLMPIQDDEPTLEFNIDLRAVFGLLTLTETKDLSERQKGELVYQLPDTGPSFWQAKPSVGWVEVKLAPFTHNVHHYGLLMQTLYPGAAVREHAHNQLNEFFIITKGTARAALDGVEAISVIVIGRNVWHWWGHAGEGDAQNFAVIDPPGVEGALALAGRLRTKGESWPDDIVRSPETGKILHDRYGFVIKAGAADAQR